MRSRIAYWYLVRNLNLRLMSGAVARRLGCSAAWVRRLDAELRPEFTAEGRRLYDAAVVEGYARRREAARKAS